VRAAACEAVAPLHLRLTLLEGKYHQVKRMVAGWATGSRACTARRSAAWSLPADLAPGQWRWLGEAELALLKPWSGAPGPARAGLRAGPDTGGLI
jgi:16S rRNA pseudouridine516 synthase